MAFDFDELEGQDLSGEADLTLYLQACTMGGGAKGLSAEYLALLREIADTALKDGISGKPARQLLALICHSAAMTPSVCSVLADRDSAVFQSFLQFVLQATGLPALELRAVREEKCTGEICPGVPRLQLNFLGLCTHCFMRLADKEAAAAAGGQAGIYAPFICQGAGQAADGPAFKAPDELVRVVREVADAGKAGEELAQMVSEWPVPWQRLVAHLTSMRALELAAEAAGAPLGASGFDALRRIECLSPPLKVKTLRSVPVPGKSSASTGLMLILHGGLQTERHLKFMHMGAGLNELTPPSGCGMEMLGVEADFAYEALASGLTKPAVGFGYVRFEGCFARFGEYVLSAARIYQQCIERHLNEHPTGCPVDVDLYGFSAGGMLAWLLLCMMPLAARQIRLRTLILLSPRLEGLYDCWEDAHLRTILATHGTQIFLGYGEFENLPEQGRPFSAAAERIKDLLPSPSSPPESRFHQRAYEGAGHTMPMEELGDVKAFLRDVWKSLG